MAAEAKTTSRLFPANNAWPIVHNWPLIPIRIVFLALFLSLLLWRTLPLNKKWTAATPPQKSQSNPAKSEIRNTYRKCQACFFCVDVFQHSPRKEHKHNSTQYIGRENKSNKHFLFFLIPALLIVTFFCPALLGLACPTSTRTL